MLGSLFASKSIALTVKDYAIRCLTYTPSGDVSSTYEHLLPNGIVEDGQILDKPALLSHLVKCVGKVKGRRKRASFFVPDAIVIVRSITIPLDIQPDEFRGYILLELGVTIHLPFEDPVFDYHLVASDGDKQHVLLFAAPRDVAQDYSDLCKDAGLKPVVADISALSLQRFSSVQDRSSFEGHTLLLQANLVANTVSFFQDAHLVFMRHMKSTLQPIDWEAIQVEREILYRCKRDEGALQMDWRQLTEELSRVLNYYRYTLHKGEVEVDRILVSGDHPDLPDIISAIQARFEQMPVLPINSQSREELSGKHHIIPVRFHELMGVPLRGGQPHVD